MFISRRDVHKLFDDVNTCGLSIEEIQHFCKTVKITLTPKQISDFLLEEAKQNGVDMQEEENELFSKKVARFKYSFNAKDYEFYKKSLEIYVDKCFKFCHLLNMLAGYGPLSTEILSRLDITVQDGKVLKNDVLRIIKPLIVNYNLAVKVKEKAENPETYLTQIFGIDNKKTVKDYLPDTSLLGRRYKPSNESIALTGKQLKEWDERYKKQMQEILQSRKDI